MFKHTSDSETPHLLKVQAVRAAKLVADSFSAHQYDTFFSDRVIFASWTVTDALAIWHFLGLLCFRVSMDAMQCGDSQFRIECYEAGLNEALCRWHVPGRSTVNLEGRIEDHHEDFHEAYSRSIANPELSRAFFLRIVERILDCAPESNSGVNWPESGTPASCIDALLPENVSKLFAEALDEARQVFGASRTSKKVRLLSPGEKPPTVLSVRVTRGGAVIHTVSGEGRSMIMMRSDAK